LDAVREKVFPCIETHFVKEKSLLKRALFREVIRQACVRRGKATAELISFVIEAGIENVRITKSLADLKCYVHPTTMKSIEKYCERKHRNNEEKMLNAMVSSYKGRVRVGEIGGEKTAELISFVREVGIGNVRDAKLLDLENCVHETTMKSMEKFCENVHGGNEEKMLNAMVSIYEGRVRGREIGGGSTVGGETTSKLNNFITETGIENVRVSKSLADLKCYVHPTTMDSMVNHCEDVHKRDEEMMMKAMDSVQSRGKKAADIRWMQE
jgi:hypothetical protein